MGPLMVILILGLLIASAVACWLLYNKSQLFWLTGKNSIEFEQPSPQQLDNRRLDDFALPGTPKTPHTPPSFDLEEARRKDLLKQERKANWAFMLQILKTCQTAPTTIDPQSCPFPTSGFYCPLTNTDVCASLVVKRVFASKTKPLEIHLLDDAGHVIRRLVFKKEDLRKEAAVMAVMGALNQRFKYVKWNGHPTVTTLYKIKPVDSECGVIEFLENTLTLSTDVLSQLSKKILNTEQKRENFICTLAPSLASVWLLGIRDRHFRNILVNTEDGSVIHIDFGWVFGDQPALDTAKIPLSKDIKDAIGDEWNDFAYLVWQLIESVKCEGPESVKSGVAKILSKYSVSEEDVEKATNYIEKAMSISKKKFIGQVNSAPYSIKTFIKRRINSVVTMDIFKSKSE